MGSAGKLGRPVDIAAFRGRGKNRIYRIGIELEGGWNVLPQGTSRLVPDSSVHCVGQAGSGELNSPPLPIETWEAWMDKHFPQVVDASCGMHVHISFETALIYQRLMTPTYPGTIVAAFKEWSRKEGIDKGHHIWGRLAGKSIYCQHVYAADEQVMSREKDYNRERTGHRYTVINYAYGKTNTLECRLLPMFPDLVQSKRAVQEFLDVTNAFLQATRVVRRRETGGRVEVKSDDEAVRERRISV